MALGAENQPAPTDSLGSVSAARLGERLRAIRRTRKLSRRHVARRTGIPKRRLRGHERGTDVLDDAGLHALLGLYQLTLPELLPERPPRSVSVDGNAVRVGAHVRVMGATRPTADAALAAYLLTIAELRGIDVGTDLALREDDLEALAETLGRDPATIEERLVALTRCSHHDAVELRRVLLRQRVLAPAATVVAGAAALTMTIGLPGVGTTEPPLRAPRAPAVEIEPGTRGPSGPAGEAGQEREARGPSGPAGEAGQEREAPGPSGPAGAVDIGTAIVVEHTPDGRTVERIRGD